MTTYADHLEEMATSLDLGEWDEIDMDAVEAAIEARVTARIFPVTTLLWEGR